MLNQFNAADDAMPFFASLASSSNPVCDFLNALCLFCARRGGPDVVFFGHGWSDAYGGGSNADVTEYAPPRFEGEARGWPAEEDEERRLRPHPHHRRPLRRLTRSQGGAHLGAATSRRLHEAIL